MKRFSNYLIIGIIIFGLILTGCDKRKDVERGADTYFEALNSEELIAEGDYPNLSNLLGNLTAKELMDVLDGSLKTLNALADQGYTSSDDYQTLLNIITNLYNMMLEDKASIIHLDARAFVHKCKDKFDLIFMDPPYNKGLATQMAPIVCRLLAGDGILVIEHSPREEIDPPKAEIWKKSIYGDTCVTYIKKEVESQ